MKEEQETFKVTVLPGHTVRHNGKDIAPGGSFYCSEDEAFRLWTGDIVDYADDQDSSDSPGLSKNEKLMRAIDSLDQDKSDRKFWTLSSLPQVKALEEITGESVTATERTVAYKEYQQLNQDQG